MLKKIFFIIVSILVVFASTITVNASTVTRTFTPSKNEVKPGETFSVVLHVNCEDGINGATGIKYNYEQTKVELVSQNVKDSNFSNIGTSEEIDLISNSTDTITSSDLYEFTFKVKNSVSVGTEINISIADFNVDSDAGNNSSATIDGISAKVTVISATPSGGTTSGNQGTSSGGAGTTDSGKTSGGTTSTGLEKSSGQTTPSVEDKNDTPKTAGKETKEVETASQEKITNKETLPYTGAVTGIGIAVVIVIAVGIVSYLKYNKYKKV